MDENIEDLKVEIPEFVNDWLKNIKAKNYGVLGEISHLEDSLTSQNMREEHKVYFWLKENFDTFAKAWLSYPDVEIEEEKRYYVLFGNQFHDDNWTYALTNSGSIEIFEKDVLPEWDITKLTEQEIKDYDERYWLFRQPVEEMNND